MLRPLNVETNPHLNLKAEPQNDVHSFHIITSYASYSMQVVLGKILPNKLDSVSSSISQPWDTNPFLT